MGLLLEIIGYVLIHREVAHPSLSICNIKPKSNHLDNLKIVLKLDSIITDKDKI